MSWYMPSYGRPERLRTMLDAPGGWPQTVFVMVNEDDPERQRYYQINDQLLHDYRKTYGARDNKPAPPWCIFEVPAGSRCADAHRQITSDMCVGNTNEFVGLLCDDHWPITPGWWKTMEEAAGDRYIAAANGSPQFPKIRSAVCFGGKLVEAMGSLVPATKIKHNFEDDLWDTVAADFNILRPLKDVVVEHRHPVHRTAVRDATYDRGSADFYADEKHFAEWLESQDRLDMYDRIGALLGKSVGTFDPKGIELAIVVPIQADLMDAAYHSSIYTTMRRLHRAGVSFSLQETTGGSHIGKAREGLLWKAYYWEPRPTHIMFIDADMGWDPGLVIKLLATGHEVCAVPGVRKQDAITICANFFDNPQQFHPDTGFLKVKEVGMAFTIIKMTAINKMIAAYPELRYKAPRPEYALFLDMVAEPDPGQEYGERMSEDFSFCRRWRKIGGEIWIDPQARLVHVGKKEYTGCVMDIATVQDKAAA